MKTNTLGSPEATSVKPAAADEAAAYKPTAATVMSVAKPSAEALKGFSVEVKQFRAYAKSYCQQLCSLRVG